MLKSVSLVSLGLMLLLSAHAGAAIAPSAPIAPNAFSCVDLRKATQKIPVYVTNIANANTTKTADGGPYKRIELVCKEQYCASVIKDDFKLVKNPSHPDANVAGYVRYPAIDVSSEFAALSAAASEVKLLAAKGLCGTSALESPTMALIKYDKGTSIQSDVFNFNTEGRLVSWSRTLADGVSQHVAFNADGSIGKTP